MNSTRISYVVNTVPPDRVRSTGLKLDWILSQYFITRLHSSPLPCDACDEN